MLFNEFIKSIADANPPAALNSYARSLWYDAKGDWETAHTTIQDIKDKNAAWIHAYLHRKEGALSNADYWYARAGRGFQRPELDEEWRALVDALIAG